MPEQCFEDKWEKFQKDLRELGVKVSLTFHQICTFISLRAFWTSAELQDFTHHSHIPCSPQGKGLLQASFDRRICSSKEARWDLGFSSFFPLSMFKIWNLECILQPLLRSGTSQTVSICISTSTWLILTERREGRPVSAALLLDSNFSAGRQWWAPLDGAEVVTSSFSTTRFGVEHNTFFSLSATQWRVPTLSILGCAGSFKKSYEVSLTTRTWSYHPICPVNGSPFFFFC